MKFIKWILEKLKKLVIFFVKQTGIFIFRTFLLVMLLVGIGYSMYVSFESKRISDLNKKYEYVEIDMNRDFKEGNQKLIDLILGDKVSYYNLIETLKDIENDPKVKGVIFKLDGYSLSAAQTEEISKIVERISKNKDTYAYSTGFTKNDYSFALGTKQILMPFTQTSTSNIVGYGIEMPFYKRIADKFGVNFTVVHMGAYKSFGENLVSTSMSDYSKENLTSLLNNVYDNFITRVAEKRGIAKDVVSSKILNGEIASATPYELKELNLIDKDTYYSDLKRELGEKNIIVLDEYRDVKAMQDMLVNKVESSNKIGIITLSGSIVESEDKGKEVITPENVEKVLNKALEDEEIKGIVLRMDSPGGSALSSQIIYNMIMKGKEFSKKPVYVSMGSVAASGGYYISVSGDKIYANKNTITGSVGVVSIVPNISGLASKVGVDFEVLTNGKNTELNSIIQQPTKERLALLLKSNSKVYDEFKSRVATGRGLTLDEVEKVAKGRVWTGDEALSNKMIDGIATLDEVTNLLAEDLKIENDFSVVEITEEDFKGDFKAYLGIFKKGVVANIILDMDQISTITKILNFNAEPFTMGSNGKIKSNFIKSKNGQLLYAPYIENIE